MARIATRARSLARAAAILALLPACGEGGRDSGNATAQGSATLELVRAIGRRNPELSSFLSQHHTAFRPETVDTASAWARHVDGLARADVRLTLRSGEIAASLWGRADLTLRLAPVDAFDSHGELTEGAAVFRNRFTATDAVVLVARARIEELLVLHDVRAPNHFEWRLHRGSGLAPGERHGDALVFRAAGGKGELRIPPVVAVDARGDRQSASMRLEGDRLVVDLDHAQALHPVVLDPGVESGAWTAGPPIDAVGESPAMAYDPVRQRVVLVAGAYKYEQAAGTWEYDGTSWTRVTTMGPMASGAAMAWFPPHQKIVLHGGADPFTQTVRNDAWEWDGTTWTSLGAWDTRYWHGMAYDSVRQRLVIHGGAAAGGGSQVLGSTLEWDGNGAPIEVTNNGPARFALGLVFDPASQKILCIGGQNTFNTQYSDFVWDGSTWTDLQLGIGRTFPAVVADKLRKVVLADGGKANPADWPLDDTRLFTGSAWTPFAATGAPPARSAHAAAFDEARGNIVVVGGNLIGSWTLALQGGSCTTGSECSSGHCVDGVCCQSATCGVCEACNIAGSEGTCAAVKGAPDDTCPAPSVCDSAGNKLCGAQPGKPCQSDSECPGSKCSASGTCLQHCATGSECSTGFCADGYCCNAACTGQCEDCTSGLCEATLGPPVAGRPSCGDGTECSMTCTGQDRQSCQFPGSQTPCAASTPSSCASDSELLRSACNGAGQCAQSKQSCSPYLCVNAACTSSCATDEACDEGYTCQAGKCSAAGSGTCLTDNSVKLLDGTIQQCGLYRCSGGKCLIHCDDPSDCVGGICKAGRCRSTKEFPAAELAGVICAHSSLPARSGGVSLMIAGILAALGLARRK